DVELLAQLRRERARFRRLLGRLDPAAHGGKRGLGEADLGLLQVGERVQRRLVVARRGELAGEIARPPPPPALPEGKERLDQPAISGPALHRLAVVVDRRGGIGALDGGERGAALAENVMRDSDQCGPDRLAGPQGWFVPHGTYLEHFAWPWVP